jgi:hypothetical protein
MVDGELGKLLRRYPESPNVEDVSGSLDAGGDARENGAA